MALLFLSYLSTFCRIPHFLSGVVNAKKIVWWIFEIMTQSTGHLLRSVKLIFDALFFKNKIAWSKKCVTNPKSLHCEKAHFEKFAFYNPICFHSNSVLMKHTCSRRLYCRVFSNLLWNHLKNNFTNLGTEKAPPKVFFDNMFILI